jgi:hypothetical protein
LFLNGLEKSEIADLSYTEKERERGFIRCYSGWLDEAKPPFECRVFPVATKPTFDVPCCGRCTYDVIRTDKQLKDAIQFIKKAIELKEKEALFGFIQHQETAIQKHQVKLAELKHSVARARKKL